MAFANSGGTRIYWEESGDLSGNAQPVLLIMGLGYAHQMWFRTRPILEANYRTILFDNRGVGKSGVPEGPYPIAQMADDCAAVLDAAGVERAHVYGISMGGMIAQEFAIRYPARVNRLILGCTACGGSKAVAAAAPVLQVLMARATMNADEGAEAMVPYIYDASTPRARIDEDLAIRRTVYPTSQGYMGQVQGIMAWSCFDRLDAIKTSTLIMHGETDQLVPPENAKIIGDRIGGSEIVMLANASHIYSTDQPEKSHAAIMRFLAG